MKIVFLCGSLEPGRDGVGDYTRRLAGELIRQGHQVAALALNDPFISEESVGTQHSENIEVPVFRVPARWTASKRINLAKVWIDVMDPEWLSLQFVIFSFHPKGLPFGLAKQLAILARGRYFHIMFHEIWVGFASISPVKHKILGSFQRRIIKNALKALKVNLVTTTNGLYQSILSRDKIQSNILPLFSNIPVANPDEVYTSEIFKKLSILEEERNKWRIIGIFGSLYPEAKLEKAIMLQLVIAQESEKSLAFIGFGRIDEMGLKEFDRLKTVFSDNVRFLHFGELPPENISRLFQILDLGISCTPRQHIGKSGVFAAMKNHGLEVELPHKDIIPEFDLEIKRYNNKLIKKPAEEWNVAYVATQFINLFH